MTLLAAQERVRSEMEEQALSQAELAKRVGVSARTIARFLSGHPVDALSLRKISVALWGAGYAKLLETFIGLPDSADMRQALEQFEIAKHYEATVTDSVNVLDKLAATSLPAVAAAVADIKQQIGDLRTMMTEYSVVLKQALDMIEVLVDRTPDDAPSRRRAPSKKTRALRDPASPQSVRAPAGSP